MSVFYATPKSCAASEIRDPPCCSMWEEIYKVRCFGVAKGEELKCFTIVTNLATSELVNFLKARNCACFEIQMNCRRRVDNRWRSNYSFISTTLAN